jgi:hypothetical protein
MKELSLHILDIANNSVAADATLITIEVCEDIAANSLIIRIEDNGRGMSPELLSKVRDPFTTSRKTRKVGLGIPLFENAAKASGGGLDIKSTPGAGTCVTAWFKHDSIDRQPLGDIAATLITLITTNPDRDFIYRHITQDGKFELDTVKVKKILQGVPISSFEIAKWLENYIRDGISTIRR